MWPLFVTCSYVWTLEVLCDISCLSSKGNASFYGDWLTSPTTRVHICSFPMTRLLKQHFASVFISTLLFSVGDVTILLLAQDSGLRIISRLRFRFDGAKSQSNPYEGSAPTGEKMVGCPALLRLLQYWSHQTQFRKEEPLQPRPSTALGRKEMEAFKCKRKRGRLTRPSGSDLCHI